MGLTYLIFGILEFVSDVIQCDTSCFLNLIDIVFWHAQFNLAIVLLHSNSHFDHDVQFRFLS
jgi:hypothetical protein